LILQLGNSIKQQFQGRLLKPCSTLRPHFRSLLLFFPTILKSRKKTFTVKKLFTGWFSWNYIDFEAFFRAVCSELVPKTYCSTVRTMSDFPPE
jgi:hypothetical protein